MYSAKFDFLVDVCGKIVESSENLGITQDKMMKLFPDKETDVFNFASGISSLWWNIEDIKGLSLYEIVNEEHINELVSGAVRDAYDEAYEKGYDDGRSDYAQRDSELRMNEYADTIKVWREGKGFHTPNEFSDAEGILAKIALIHSELGEASEAVRKQDHHNFSEELADTVIRLLDLTSALGIDIEEEVETKMMINKGREHKHGKVI